MTDSTSPNDSVFREAAPVTPRSVLNPQALPSPWSADAHYTYDTIADLQP